MRRRLFTNLLSAALLALTPPSALADWHPDGSQLSARTDAIIASDGRGGVFGATGYPDRFCLLYQLSASGDSVKDWPRAGRELTPDVSLLVHNTTVPVVLQPDGAGGTFVLTAEQIGYNGHGGFLFPVQFFVHRRTATGDPAPGWTPQGVLVSTPVIEHSFEVRHLPTMVSDGQGGVFVAWLYHLSTEFPNPPLYAQRVTGSGERAWGEDGVVVRAGPGVCTVPTLLADDTGGAFVFWGQWDTPRTSIRVFGQHLAPNGGALWPTEGASVSSGAFIRMDQAAPADGGWVRQFYGPAISATSDGLHGAILVWAASTGADLDVIATRVAHDGTLAWEHDRVVCGAPGEQASVTCASADRSGAVIAWRDGRAGDDVSIRTQLVARNGRACWAPAGVIIADGPGDRGPIALVSDDRDAYYFAWFDPRLGGRLFAQRVQRSGHRAPFWPSGGALVSTRASVDPLESTRVLRLVPAGRGAAIAAWSDLAGGSLVMLITPRGPAAESVAQVQAHWASGSSSSTMVAVLAVTPDPVVRAASLRFVLPAAASTSLELFDLAGRRVWSRDFGLLRAGEHLMPFAEGARLPAGVYLARLTHGAAMVTRRVVVLE